MKQFHMYNRLSFNYLRSTKDFDADCHRVARPLNSVFEDYNITWYQEFGLTDWLSLVSSIPYKFLRLEEDKVEGNTRKVSKSCGVGDIEAGLKIRLLEKPVVLSMQTLAKIPPYDMDDPIPLGNGQWDVEGRLLLGKSLWPTVPGYFGIEVGYRYRAEAPSDEFKYLVELGSHIWKGLYLRTKLDGILSMRNATAVADPRLTWLSTEYDLGKLELTAGYKISKGFDLEFTFTPYIYGRNMIAANSYSLAIAYTY